MKKKNLLLPALSGLLLSPFVLSQQVFADTELSNSTVGNSAVVDETVEAVILHTNDVHGRILEEKGVIGDAKAAAVIASERVKVENTLVVDAGDAFQGLPISNSTQGEDRARIMNEVGYDAMAVGNHEFDFGLEQAEKYKEILNFPLLSANTYVNGVRMFETHTIVDKNETIVGDEFVVIGVTTPETATKTHPKNVEGVIFADPVTEVNKVIDEVEARALADNRVYQNYIILAHLGVDTTTHVEWRGSTLAQALAENSKLAGKRVIVIDGHSHTVENATYGDNVTYSQIGSYHNNIGKITLKSGQLLAEASLIAAADTKNVVPDAKIDALVADIKAKYEQENAVVVIENNPVELNGDRSNVRVRETNLGNVIADALYVYGQTGFSKQTNLAVTNGGGIRATIAKDKPVTKGDIIAVLPFGNIISQIEVTGEQIQQMFARSLSAPVQIDKETNAPILDENGLPLLEASGGFLHISGAQVVYDPSKPEAERVLEISIYDPETDDFQLLDLEKVYYLATNDFLAAGGDGYTMLGGAREEGPSMDSVFADYLKVADLADYLEVNPNSRLVAISEEEYLSEPQELDPKPNEEDTRPFLTPIQKKGKGVLADDLPIAILPPENPTGSSTGNSTRTPSTEPVVHSLSVNYATEIGNIPSRTVQLRSTVETNTASTQLPKTASSRELSVSLFGFALAGLGLAASRKRHTRA